MFSNQQPKYLRRQLYKGSNHLKISSGRGGMAFYICGASPLSTPLELTRSKAPFVHPSLVCRRSKIQSPASLVQEFQVEGDVKFLSLKPWSTTARLSSKGQSFSSPPPPNIFSDFSLNLLLNPRQLRSETNFSKKWQGCFLKPPDRKPKCTQSFQERNWILEDRGLQL